MTAWEPFLRDYGYWAVLAAIMLEDFGLPVPGESILIAAGALAGRGKMHIALVLVAAWVGAVVGDNIGYAIGHFGGRRLVVRYGRRVLITDERLGRAERFFGRYGGAVVLGARFVAVLRQLNGIVAGTMKMPWWRFLAYNAAGATLWVGFWGMLAYEASKRAARLAAVVEGYERLLIVAGAGVLLLAAGVYVLIRRRRARRLP